MKTYSIFIKIPTFEDKRGFLTVVEDLLPFSIKEFIGFMDLTKTSAEDTDTKLQDKL